jgi:hypothetical protein
VSGALLAVAVALLPLVGAARAAAQVELTVVPAMTRGPERAPVTIVEFTDFE